MLGVIGFAGRPDQDQGIPSPIGTKRPARPIIVGDGGQFLSIRANQADGFTLVGQLALVSAGYALIGIFFSKGNPVPHQA
jgi:hypothetical protein